MLLLWRSSTAKKNNKIGQTKYLDITDVQWSAAGQKSLCGPMAFAQRPSVRDFLPRSRQSRGRTGVQLRRWGSVRSPSPEETGQSSGQQTKDGKVLLSLTVIVFALAALFLHISQCHIAVPFNDILSAWFKRENI